MDNEGNEPRETLAEALEGLELSVNKTTDASAQQSEKAAKPAKPEETKPSKTRNKSPKKAKLKAPPPERSVTIQGFKLQEESFVGDMELMREELKMDFAFCKPKLIPLKTLTTQRQEEIAKQQREQQASSSEKTPASDESDDSGEGPSFSSIADVWTRD